MASGLERTGRIVTAAALLLVLVYAAFATSGVTVVKVLGVGLALAILVDAFLIRLTLVPAFMRLAGRANWWAPRSIRRFPARRHLGGGAPAGARSSRGETDAAARRGARGRIRRTAAGRFAMSTRTTPTDVWREPSRGTFAKSAVAGAVQTLAPARTAYRALDVKVNYLGQ